MSGNYGLIDSRIKHSKAARIKSKQVWGVLLELRGENGMVEARIA